MVPRDEHAVPGGDQIGLDVVRPHLGSQAVGLDGVFGPVAGGAAVPDDDRGGSARQGTPSENGRDHDADDGVYHSSFTPSWAWRAS